MALKVTMKVAGQDVVIEGDSSDVVAAMRALQSPTPNPSAPRSPAATGPQARKTGAAARAPRGENKKIALQALAVAAHRGAKQASVQRWMIQNANQPVAVSSVRHALKQLQKEGFAMRTGAIWRISGNGVTELARLEKGGDTLV